MLASIELWISTKDESIASGNKTSHLTHLTEANDLLNPDIFTTPLITPPRLRPHTRLWKVANVQEISSGLTVRCTRL